MSSCREAVPDAGFTLVEVLVALLVVAIGIAGAVGLQARAMRVAREAERLSDGARLAASLAERMRANPVSMALADADNPYLQLDVDSAAAPPPAAASCSGAPDCTPAQLAAFDVFDVEQAVAAQLPGGRMRVCRDATPPAQGAALPAWACDGQPAAPISIKLGWRDDGAAATPKLQLPVGAGAP